MSLNPSILSDSRISDEKYRIMFEYIFSITEEIRYENDDLRYKIYDPLANLLAKIKFRDRSLVYKFTRRLYYHSIFLSNRRDLNR